METSIVAEASELSAPAFVEVCWVLVVPVEQWDLYGLMRICNKKWAQVTRVTIIISTLVKHVATCGCRPGPYSINQQTLDQVSWDNFIVTLCLGFHQPLLKQTVNVVVDEYWIIGCYKHSTNLYKSWSRQLACFSYYAGLHGSAVPAALWTKSLTKYCNSS